MYKKILLILLVFSLGFINAAQAVILIPYFNITIVKHAVGGDAAFHFNLVASYPYNSYSQGFQIQTQQGAGSFFIGATSGSGTVFTLTESPLPGWRNTHAACTSGSPGVSASPVEGGVRIVAQPFSSITCTFTNEPVAQKMPVLIVPGVLGTDMVKGSDKLWLNLGKMSSDVGDDFMDPLVFSDNLQPIDLSVYGTGMLRRQSFGPFSYDYGAGLIQEFISQGYVENQDLFTFPYDWRYGVSGKDGTGVVVNEEALKQKVQAIRTQTRADKVDVVAHSTGGLLVKKYVQDYSTSHHIGKAVFVGVPNTGAPKAVKVLLSGDNFGVPWLADEEMQKIGQNLPVLYDLAPSRTYVDRKGSFLRTIDQKFLARDVVTDLAYDPAWDLMVHSRGANQTGLSNAEAVHTSSFDDFDMRTAGVDVYNVVGCKTGTLGQVVERRKPSVFGDPNISYDVPEETPGDGTVPLESATNLPVDAGHKYYGLKVEHGKMMSQDGVRQQIVNIVAGNSLAAPHMTQDIGQCKLKGKAHAIFSPVDIEVLDQLGNRLGLAADGSVQNNIPGADFSKFGDHKFVYLPDDEGQTYNIRLKGTGDGTFTYKVQNVEDNVVTQTEVFPDVPVTTNLLGGVTSAGDQTILMLDTNGDGITDETVLPAATLNQSQSKDLMSPVTTLTPTGTGEVPGYYRSDVNIDLAAIDYAQDGAVPAGVFETKFRVDSGQWIVNSGSVQINTEGEHTIQFYSTDKAGNVEPMQNIHFTIDKTAPEATLRFNPQTKDLDVIPVDAVDSTPTVVQNGVLVTLSDKAGNTTVLTFEERDRRASLSAQLSGLSYNGVAQNISRDLFRFAWTLDRQRELQTLEQQVVSKNSFTIFAHYSGVGTTLVGRDSTGPFVRRLSGLRLLEVQTNKADFSWQLAN